MKSNGLASYVNIDMKLSDQDETLLEENDYVGLQKFLFRSALISGLCHTGL